MARIELSTIGKIEKERNIVQEKVKATYSVFEVEGQKYLQIDTYGRNNRRIPDKISQTIQFDRETAEFLCELFRTEFNL